MPEGARKVDPSTGYGNPFVPAGQTDLLIDERRGLRARPVDGSQVETPAAAVALYDWWLHHTEHGRAVAERARTELRGHDLACWCAPDQPCHADVLLRVANEELRGGHD